MKQNCDLSEPSLRHKCLKVGYGEPGKLPYFLLEDLLESRYSRKWLQFWMCLILRLFCILSDHRKIFVLERS